MIENQIFINKIVIYLFRIKKMRYFMQIIDTSCLLDIYYKSNHSANK